MIEFFKKNLNNNLKNKIKNNFIIFFILICLTSKAFSQKSVIIFKTDLSNNYMNYAVYDLLVKNIFLYSNLKIINDNSKYSKYETVKSKIKKLTTYNNADISVAYNIQNFKNGILLNYIIFNSEKPKEWIEKSVYSEEENLFISINKLLKDICYISDNKITHITEENYIALIGYYSQKINSNYTNGNENNIYKLFYNFHKDNIYFNIDYLEYLTDKTDKTNIEIIDDLTKNMHNYINKKNHYYFYSLGCMHYGKYKVNVLLDDIETSIENYNKALKLKNNHYKYYYRLANAYILKGDYDNARKYFEEAIELNFSDTAIIKEFVSLLKRDINNNGDIVINYLKKIIEINKNDEEALEDISKLYERIGDYENAIIYYNKLLDTVNYNLYIINNETKDTELYDKYILKGNSIKSKLENIGK